jgi:hypothetical protein
MENKDVPLRSVNSMVSPSSSSYASTCPTVDPRCTSSDTLNSCPAKITGGSFTLPMFTVTVAAVESPVLSVTTAGSLYWVMRS